MPRRFGTARPNTDRYSCSVDTWMAPTATAAGAASSPVGSDGALDMRTRIRRPDSPPPGPSSAATSPATSPGERRGEAAERRGEPVERRGEPAERRGEPGERGRPDPRLDLPHHVPPGETPTRSMSLG